MNLSKRIWIMLLVLIPCIGCDQATKEIARNTLANSERISLLGDTFRLQYAENSGAMLSMGAGMEDGTRFWVFTVFVGLFLVGLLSFALLKRGLPPLSLFAITMIAAGGIGNLIDRITNEGHVVDFMNLGIGSLRTGIFNVADMAIMAGVGLMVVEMLRGGGTKGEH